MAFLKVIDGSSTGQILQLSGKKIVLGRLPSCEIVLDDASVSRQHAQILEDDGIFLIEDLRSRNGTQVNRISIRGRTQLRDGDEIKVCDYTFQFLTKSTGPSVSVSTDSSFRSGFMPKIAPPAAIATIDAESDNAESEDDFPIPEEPNANSSILASMSAGTSEQGLRLNVRPEVKLRAILEISSALGKVLKLNDTLPVILQSLFKIFPQADFGFLLLKDQVSGKLRLRASLSRRGDDDDVRVSMTVVRQAMETGQAILSADVSDDRRFESSVSIAEMQLRSLMCTPLMNTNQDPLGVLQLSTLDISQPFNSDDLDLLVSVGSQAAMAVENGTMHEALIRQRDLERDMEIAAQVQHGFLPSSSPSISGYEFANYYQAAQRIGGDYYDYIRLPNGKLAMVIGDVSGKGVPAALLMARLHASCRHHLFDALTAEAALNNLNTEMVNSSLGYRFITLAIAILDPLRNEMQLASAGHLPPIVRRDGRPSEFVGHREGGMPLGVMPDVRYSSIIIPLAPNDLVMFYTDGITEATNPQNELYARERVKTLVDSGPVSVVDLVSKLLDSVDHFRDGHYQRDDICVTAVRRVT